MEPLATFGRGRLTVGDRVLALRTVIRRWAAPSRSPRSLAKHRLRPRVAQSVARVVKAFGELLQFSDFSKLFDAFSIP